MNSKFVKKATAVVLTLVMVLAVVGCTPISTKAEWSYKYKDDSLPSGVYIYSLYQAYTQAQTYAEKNDNYDENESFLDLTIKDDDGNKAKASDWIYKEADKITKNLLAVNKVYADLEKKNGATYDQATYDNYLSTAQDDWDLGYGYSYYSQMGYSTTPMKDILEDYGVSEDSYFLSTYKPQVLQDAIFEAMYQKGGTEEVSDNELKKFFLSDYTYYSYQEIDLYSSTTDDSGNSTSTALSDKEIKAIKKDVKTYVADLNKGTSWSKFVKTYDKANDLESDSSQTLCEILDDSSTPDDIVKKLADMKAGQATSIEVGEGDNALIYIVYKYDTKDGVDEYLTKDDETRTSVLQNYKSDDLTDYLNNEAKDMDIKINSYCEKFDPKMFWSKPESSSSGTSSTAS